LDQEAILEGAARAVDALVSRRYERGSIMITSNRGLDARGASLRPDL
jgi:hypothetical protein